MLAMDVGVMRGSLPMARLGGRDGGDSHGVSFFRHTPRQAVAAGAGQGVGGSPHRLADAPGGRVFSERTSRERNSMIFPIMRRWCSCRWRSCTTSRQSAEFSLLMGRGEGRGGVWG